MLKRLEVIECHREKRLSKAFCIIVFEIATGVFVTCKIVTPSSHTQCFDFLTWQYPGNNRATETTLKCVGSLVIQVMKKVLKPNISNLGG